jgi:DNA-binding NtrC family response regulator
VRVIHGRASPSYKRIGAEPIIVGAGPQAAIVIDDSRVSRAHVELSLVPEGVAVRDLGSKNGTHYQGRRVDERIVVPPGSRVHVGDAEISVEPDLEALANAPEEGQYRDVACVSPAMRKLLGVLARLEGSLASVLLEGEPGVGKGFFARAIHDGSLVASGPFVVVECASLARDPAALLGHERGAVASADEGRAGAFESADGGTLFLDEIADLPLDAQAALLRAMESGEVQRAGAAQPRKVRVRVLCATGRDIDDHVRTCRFREDLFQRLSAVRLWVPPLRERLEDVDGLARRIAAQLGLPVLPGDVVDRLRRHSFPGNVRELREAVEAYAASGALPEAVRSADQLGAALRAFVDAGRPLQPQKEQLLHHFTRTYLELVLARTGGNLSEAARISGLDRGVIRKIVGKLPVVKR